MNKIGKKAGVFILAAIMMFTCLFGGMTGENRVKAQAASKPSLSVSVYSYGSGSTYNVTVSYSTNYTKKDKATLFISGLKSNTKKAYTVTSKSITGSVSQQYCFNYDQTYQVVIKKGSKGVVTKTIKVPKAPTNVRATKYGKNSVKITWTNASSDVEIVGTPFANRVYVYGSGKYKNIFGQTKYKSATVNWKSYTYNSRTKQGSV